MARCNMTVAANTGASRTGAVTIAGQTYTVTQGAAATPCSYDLGADEQTVTALGGPATVTSPRRWVQLDGGKPGALDYRRDQRDRQRQRHGRLDHRAQHRRRTRRDRAGRRSHAHDHAGAAPLACSYALSATDQSSPAAGETVNVGVTAASGCGWTAASQAPWITVASGAAGSGNGSVQLTIAPNAGAQRVGTVTIAGHTFTVTQAAGRMQLQPQPDDPGRARCLAATFSVEITTQAVVHVDRGERTIRGCRSPEPPPASETGR